MMKAAKLEDTSKEAKRLLEYSRKQIRKRLITLVCLYVVTVVILFVGVSL